jgi:hypothetical protein
VHWDGTSWKFVAPASTAGLGAGIAAVSANNIWAIIGFGAEQWNGTSWSQIANPSGVNQLNAVTALSDGTVVAVGVGTNNSAVIVSNQSIAAPAAVSAARVTTTASPTGTMAAAVKAALVEQSFNAPSSASVSVATPQRIASLTGSTAVPTSTVATVMPDGSQAMPTPLDTALIDQFFTEVGKIDQQLRLAYYSLRPRHTTANANWDVSFGDT